MLSRDLKQGVTPKDLPLINPNKTKTMLELAQIDISNVQEAILSIPDRFRITSFADVNGQTNSMTIYDYAYESTPNLGIEIGETTISLNTTTNLFKIGNTNYPDLASAIAAAVANDVIELIDDATVVSSVTLPSGVSLIIPAPFSLTFDGSIAFTNEGTIINNNNLTLSKNATFENAASGTYQGSGNFEGDFVNNGNVRPGN